MGTNQHQKGMISNENNGKHRIDIMSQENYEGPIPHPDLFKKFDEVLSGAAERIMAMAEKEQSHRHKSEQEYFALQKLGLVCGFIIAILFVILGVFLIYVGKSITGFSLAISALASLVFAFSIKSKK
ncbi:MAG: DUF2335 domain-containing protein [Fusobacteriaceae bacterium]